VGSRDGLGARCRNCSRAGLAFVRAGFANGRGLRGNGFHTDASYMRSLHTIDKKDLEGGARRVLREIRTVSKRAIHRFASMPPPEVTAAQSIHVQRPMSL
jgi:hypothetical protein